LQTFIGIVVAYAVAALAGMGVGGGGLLVIYLTLVLGTGQLEAQGINLVFFICSSAASMIVHLKKRKFNWKIVVVCMISALVGGYFGSVLATVTKAILLRKLFGGFMLVSGLLVFFRKKKEIEKK